MPTIWRKIMKKIDINEYNDWLKRQRNFDKFDRFLMWTGVRLYLKNEKKMYPAEYLPPEPKEAIEYYHKLTSKK